jgi:hypothetical protein
MRTWVYKVNSRRPGEFTGWHFDQFFRYRGRRPYEMGGREWIKSPQSWRLLRRVQRSDLFICYQSDERAIYGLAHAAGAAYESMPGSGRFDSIDFDARGLRLSQPVDVRQHSLFRHIGAFTVPSRGTIHALRADERNALLRLLSETNPKQRAAIARFALSGISEVRDSVAV